MTGPSGGTIAGGADNAGAKGACVGGAWRQTAETTAEDR